VSAALTVGQRDGPMGEVCLSLTGEVDLSNCDLLQEMIEDVLRDPGVVGLRLDLTALRFIDAAGLRCLIRAKRSAESHGVHFCTLNAGGIVLRVMDLFGLGKDLSPP
jgi:anti-sigma B factor antagonist